MTFLINMPEKEVIQTLRNAGITQVVLSTIDQKTEITLSPRYENDIRQLFGNKIIYSER